MQGEDLFAFVFMVGMVAGVIVIVMAMRQRSLQLEMQHRERMAMIERGQVPTEPPHPAHRLAGAVSRPGAPVVVGARYMSLGIVVVALGLGLMTIVSVAGGAPDAGVGIGGAIIILGLAFIANSLVSRSYPPEVVSRNYPPDLPPPPPPRHEDIR
jgi:hypothetical protein